MPPGWYENPEAPRELRWFDGTAWSQFTKEHPTPSSGVLPQPHASPDPAPFVVLAAPGSAPAPGASRLPAWLAPPGSAWQAVVAGYLGIVTVVCAVWPLVGLGVWAVTAAFAGWALLRIRQDVLLGERWRALAGLASGVAPLWTTALMLAYR